MIYSEISAEARDRLRGNWGPSIGTALVASLLGGAITRAGSGSSGGSGSAASFNAAEFEHMPEPVITFVIGLIGVIALLSLLQFIIGGTVQLGYAGYLLRQNPVRIPGSLTCSRSSTGSAGALPRNSWWVCTASCGPCSL